MKNILKYITIITFISFTAWSCADDHFDVNVPSGAVDESQLSMSDLMGPVIHSTVVGNYSVSQTYSNYAQYIVGQGGTASGFTTASSLWNEVYLFILPNVNTIKEKADAAGATHYSGIADILTAMNIGIATDTWDNIPYSQASQGTENLSPSFDEQEAIYSEIMTLLDSAIATLSQADNSGISPSRDDLIYGGDTDKWLRAAYTLKARYQLRLLSKGLANPSDIMNTVANGFSSNDDDFQMDFDERIINPWYAREVAARATGNFHNDIASQFISSMNGDYFPFASAAISEDPRLRVFVDNDFFSNTSIPNDIVWKGYVSGGQGLAPDGTEGNTAFAADSYYTSQASPLVVITNAEAKFIMAEAAFMANGGTTTSVGSSAAAYNAYLEGIQASMDKFGVDGSAYLADASVAVGANQLKLEHIMKEKYVHNFLNSETFSDFRRYNFSEDVFRGLTIREGADEEDPEFAGLWFRRANYPDSERNRNEAVVLANEQSPIAPVWWDE